MFPAAPANDKYSHVREPTPWPAAPRGSGEVRGAAGESRVVRAAGRSYRTVDVTRRRPQASHCTTHKKSAAAEAPIPRGQRLPPPDAPVALSAIANRTAVRVGDRGAAGTAGRLAGRGAARH